MSRSKVVFGVAIVLQIAGAILAKEDVVGELAPCTDFLSYACKVRNSTEETFSVGIRQARKQMNEFIENYHLKVALHSEAERKFYKFRKYCSRPTSETKKKFLRTYNPSVGGWPAFDKNWKADKFDLQAALAELHSLFFPTIFMISLESDPNSFINQIELKLKLSDPMYRDEFKRFMKAKLPYAMDNVDEVISDSLIVEGLYVAEKNATDDEDVPTDYKGLKQEIPEIDWDKQLETIYGQKVPDSFPVKIHKLGPMKRIIRNIFKVEPKVMANYLLYRLGHMLPDLDEEISTELFQNVVYQMIIKQKYSNETKDEIRGMLVSFLTTLANTVNLFGDEDKQNIEKAINEFVMNEIVPDLDDSYYDNVYKNVTVSESDCYSTATQLAKIHIKTISKERFQRKIDPLHEMKFKLKKTMTDNLLNFLHKPSAIRFEVLTWDLLKNNYFNRNPESLSSVRQCIEKQIGQELAQHEIEEVLQFQVFTKAYFDWAKDKENLMHLEETKYGDSSKKILLERLIARYCNLESSQEKAKISGVIVNLQEVADVYNCPVGSPHNPQTKCEIV